MADVIAEDDQIAVDAPLSGASWSALLKPGRSGFEPSMSATENTPVSGTLGRPRQQPLPKASA